MFQLFSDRPRRHCSLSSTLTFQFLSLPLHLSLLFFPLLVSAKKVVSQPWACRFCYWILFLTGKWEVFLGNSNKLQKTCNQSCWKNVLRGQHVVKLTTGLSKCYSYSLPKIMTSCKTAWLYLYSAPFSGRLLDLILLGKVFMKTLTVIRNTF